MSEACSIFRGPKADEVDSLEELVLKNLRVLVVGCSNTVGVGAGAGAGGCIWYFPVVFVAMRGALLIVVGEQLKYLEEVIRLHEGEALPVSIFPTPRSALEIIVLVNFILNLHSTLFSTEE